MIITSLIGAKVFHGKDDLDCPVDTLYELNAEDIQGNNVDFEQFRDKVKKKKKKDKSIRFLNYYFLGATSC